MNLIQNWNVLGMFVRILADASSTGGSDLFDAIVQPGGGTPLHVHSVESESFYILEGMLTFTIGETTLQANPGDLVQGVPGVPHAFRNETSTPARMICTSIPGGRHAAFFRDIGERLPEHATSAPAVDFTEKLAKRVAAASDKYGIRVLTQ